MNPTQFIFTCLIHTSFLLLAYILHLAYVTACLLIYLVSKLIGERSKLIQMNVYNHYDLAYGKNAHMAYIFSLENN